MGPCTNCNPTSTPCDLSSCNHCAGSQCLTCYKNEKVKCCLRSRCQQNGNRCQGSQCLFCWDEHRASCCGDYTPNVPECPCSDDISGDNKPSRCHENWVCSDEWWATNKCRATCNRCR